MAWYPDREEIAYNMLGRPSQARSDAITDEYREHLREWIDDELRKIEHAIEGDDENILDALSSLRYQPTSDGVDDLVAWLRRLIDHLLSLKREIGELPAGRKI